MSVSQAIPSRPARLALAGLVLSALVVTATPDPASANALRGGLLGAGAGALFGGIIGGGVTGAAVGASRAEQRRYHACQRMYPQRRPVRRRR